MLQLLCCDTIFHDKRLVSTVLLLLLLLLLIML